MKGTLLFLCIFMLTASSMLCGNDYTGITEHKKPKKQSKLMLATKGLSAVSTIPLGVMFMQKGATALSRSMSSREAQFLANFNASGDISEGKHLRNWVFLAFVSTVTHLVQIHKVGDYSDEDKISFYTGAAMLPTTLVVLACLAQMSPEAPDIHKALFGYMIVGVGKALYDVYDCFARSSEDALEDVVEAQEQ